MSNIIVVSSQVFGPDKNGIKKVIEMIIDNETGKRGKRTRISQISKKNISIPKSVIERKSWKKYGECLLDSNGPDPATTVVCKEEIPLFLKARNNFINEENENENENENKFEVEKKIIKCRNCGEDGHWTTKCQKEKIEIQKNTEINKLGKYILPSIKNYQKKEHTVRITNLPEEMTREDLYDITNCFGKTDRVHLVTDFNTGLSKGFAFVTFYKKSDGEEMIQKIHGHKYGCMILSADWAKSRKEET
jgi:translation initiation factor 3 subunit G